MDRGRIGYFIHHYPQPGGTTTALRGLSRALIGLGWDVLVYCCSGKAEPADYEEPNGIRVARYRKPRWRYGFDLDRRLLARLSGNEDRIDLLVINGLFKPLNAVVARAARRGRLPYIVWPHDPYHSTLVNRGWIRRFVYGPLVERPLLQRALAVHVLAETHRTSLVEYGVRTPAFVVPDGFDPDEVPDIGPYHRPSADDSGDGPRLLYLGRLDAYNKGLDLLFEGVALGLREGALPRGLRIDLVGADRGSQNQLDMLRARLGLGPNVEFRGYITHRTRWEIIQSYDLLLLPSRWDGFGLAALEAMVMRKPVIVSNQAGIASYVDQAKCGWIVEANAPSVCQGLVRAVTCWRDWQAMGERARRFAYSNLTWDHIARQVSAHYERLLDRRPKASSIDNGALIRAPL